MEDAFIAEVEYASKSVTNEINTLLMDRIDPDIIIAALVERAAALAEVGPGIEVFTAAVDEVAPRGLLAKLRRRIRR